MRSQPLDVERVRADFPILKKKVHGKKLIYLDNAATTQKPRSVVEAIGNYYTRHNANPHRGVHQLSIEATEVYDDSRRKIGAFIGATDFDEVIFTSGATESLNLVRYGWGGPNIEEGDLMVLTMMEHHSNVVPWQLLAAEKGARIEFVKLTEDGKLDMGHFHELMEESPALVAFTQCSNVLGTINDTVELCAMAREAGATTVVDAAQSVPHMAVDVKKMGCDFLAFSGHKMLGPMGSGILYGRKEKLEKMQPFKSGGDMIKEVHTTGSTWNDLPYKFEAGTQNVEGVVGLSAAVDYLQALGMDSVRAHEKDLVSYAMSRMMDAPGITIYGPVDPSERGGVISFNLGDIHPHDIASILDEEGVAVRSGHHCAQPLMESLGIPAATRASFYVYNTREEVDALMDALSKARRIFCI